MAPIVDCPVCGRRTEFAPANRWRPFCSQRCKTIDLARWMDGSYAVPEPVDLSTDDLLERPAR